MTQIRLHTSDGAESALLRGLAKNIGQAPKLDRIADHRSRAMRLNHADLFRCKTAGAQTLPHDSGLSRGTGRGQAHRVAISVNSHRVAYGMIGGSHPHAPL